MHAIASKIGPLMAHFLASAAFKKLIGGIVCKFIGGVIASCVLKFLAAQLAATLGSSTIMWIVIPLVAGILVHQIRNFPEKLGHQVAASVRGHLFNNFRPVNKNILEQVFDQVFNGEELLKAVAEDKKVQHALMELGKKE